ncbi:MAG: hypothetical protein F6K65_06030 [Moorea sp. SIO3C2]|nr:hypothetical protein [Moorena sp. SIO3C2]
MAKRPRYANNLPYTESPWANNQTTLAFGHACAFNQTTKQPSTFNL